MIIIDFIMNNICFAFLVTTIAGLSTMLGMIPVFFKIKDKDKIITSTD